MLQKKESRESKSWILLIFSAYAYIRKALSNAQEGLNRMILASEETGLSVDMVMNLVWREEGWMIKGKRLSENNPFYLYTENDEKLLLLLSAKTDCLGPTEKIRFKQNLKIQIGNAFKNQIFYDCYSLMNEEHAQISFENNECTVCNPGYEGVYVNEKLLDGKRRLNIGDCVDIYGLHILILKDLLVCVSFCGIFRVAQRKDIQEREKPYSETGEKKEEIWIERRCEQERALHAGEVEILLPEQPMAESEQPFILSVGPTLTMVLPMLLMAQLSSRFMEGMGSGFYYMSIVMGVSSAFLALFWGLINHGYRKYSRKREGREKESQYREYLDNIESYLLQCERDNRAVLEQKYPSLNAILGEGDGRAAVLWNRYYRQKDFLFLRVGVGVMPFQVQVKLSDPHKRIVQGKLARKAQELAEQFSVLEQVPAVVDLYENRQVGIVGSLYREEVRGMLVQLLMQIAVCHCYTEVKTVCFYHKDKVREQEIADCMKWMPHSWSADRKIRFLAGNEKEAARILPVLAKELAKEGEREEKGMRIPWYIVVVLNENLIQGEILYKYLTDPLENCPVSTIFAGMEREEVPKSCRCLISKAGEDGEILNLGREQISRRKVGLETCSSTKALEYVRRTAGFRVREAQVSMQLPEQVSFLQLYGCTRVEELESERRWKLSRTEERIKVPIGHRAGGNLVSLDVHERFHGPHGLIAGTTGSGKSELLQTYLLSLAVSFGPTDVNFFMIDYKGGGTGNFLKNLPHCAGVISNLSGKQIKRAMSAISSENKRRQMLLSSFQVNHIDAYTKLYREGKAEKPMPHLILVVDEFAELKKEEPEFMQEIISLAQVGRSLGVHLILATQKPAGTVDDKIWSNARFRLCLRVQDKQDSMDMLHNGDAALLTFPGQCYLQIGNHEYYELFQTGYCGGSYTEEGERKTRAALLQNTGEKRKVPEQSISDEGLSQMEILVDYISQTAKRFGYPPAQELWLPELPERVLLEDIESKEKDKDSGQRKVDIVLGLCDDPENQRQFTFLYQPLGQGHLAVFGGPATGKTIFLETIMWQLTTCFTPDEIWTVAVDIGRESLGCFQNMPNCLGVLKKKEDKDIFFHHLEELCTRRKNILSGSNFRQYNKSGKGKLPLVFVVIDNFGGLNRLMDEKQQDFLQKLASEGLTLGIYLIISAEGVGEVGGRFFEKIKTALALEMSDRFLYGDVFRQYYIPVLPKENQKGRGLCKANDRILEFQTALVLKEQDDFAFYGIVERRGTERERIMREEGKMLPVKFAVIPEKPDYGTVAACFEWSTGRLPLGYCLSTGEVCAVSVDDTACFLISGAERTGRTALLRCLIEGAVHHRYQTVLIDMGGRMQDFRKREEVVYLSREAEIESWQEMVFGERQRNEKICIFISDISSFCSFIYHFGEKREERIMFWEKAAMGKAGNLFLAGIFHPGRDYEAAGTVFFREFTAWQQGIHLGGNVAGQRALMFDDLSYAQQNQHEPPGIGYFKEGPEQASRRLLLLLHIEEKGQGQKET